MRIVAANELQNWLANGQVLEQDSRGPKVVRLDDGSFLKIFRSQKPLLARWRPQARRFARNAERLRALGISTPEILECCWLEQNRSISACLYNPLQGVPLDNLFKQQRKQFDSDLPNFVAFIRQLHRQGIYFRSLHLGNVLKLPHDNFGLIDFLDLRFKEAPLSKNLIHRNFAHLKNYLERRQIENFPWDRLMEYYKCDSSLGRGIADRR